VAHLLGPHLGDLDIDPAEGPDPAEVVQAQRERARTLVELARISAFYYKDFERYDEKTAGKALKAQAVEPLREARRQLETLPSWNRASVKGALDGVVARLGIGFGKLGMPLRAAVTGGTPSPELDLTLELVGRDATLRRIDRALEHIRAHGG
jgi:glutamyl-tRNA synthetase